MVRPRASQKVRRCSTASRSECVVWLHRRAGVVCDIKTQAMLELLGPRPQLGLAQPVQTRRSEARAARKFRRRADSMRGVVRLRMTEE